MSGNKRIYNLQRDEPDKRDFISFFKNKIQIIKKKTNNKIIIIDKPTIKVY